MHLQQTKRGSLKSGGPQYYFHELTDSVKVYLRAKGAVRVALVTPYGATRTDYFAVSENRKLDGQLRPVPGRVGHDRVQRGRARVSIGESIRYWYNLASGDFETIALDVEAIDDAFYLTPLWYKYAKRDKATSLHRIDRPLTFTREYVSPFWKRQIGEITRKQSAIVRWSLDEIARVVKDHAPKPLAHIQEPDVLRASGPLKHLGCALGGYVGKGYDCISEFCFLNYPAYEVPVEVKKRSRDFSYQQQKYGKDLLSRAAILCITHDHTQLPKNIDVIELQAMAEYGR
jgi:hypothetical protein